MSEEQKVVARGGMTNEQRLLRECLKALRWMVSTIREDRRAARRWNRMLEAVDALIAQGDDWEATVTMKPPLIIPDVRTMVKVQRG
jgi:hypothetical protein